MLDSKRVQKLCEKNVQIIGPRLNLSASSTFAPPCGLKLTQAEGVVSMGAFSYAVSGYLAFATIGRYCSFGEQIQIGRQNHPLDWLSTSPFLYMSTSQIIDVQTKDDIPSYSSYPDLPAPTIPIITNIGNDVWIGHGAYIKAGVNIGHGAIVAGMSVVTKNVPPYAVVAGNPARVKKYRIPEKYIELVLNTQWWDYAPWQLNDLPVHDIPLFLEKFSLKQNTEDKYNPRSIQLSSLDDVD